MPNNTLVCFGDSQVSNNRDEDYPGAKSNNVSFGWFPWANQRLNQAFKWAANIGHPGYKIDHFSQYLAQAFAYNPGWIMCEGGGNNFGAGETADAVKPKVLAVIDAILARGINCVWLLFPPSSSGSTAQTNANHEHNAWIKSLVDTRTGLYVVDLVPGLADTNGNMSGAYSADGSHLNELGGYKAGQIIYAAIQQFVPRVNRLPVGNPAYELANITTNVLNAGTSGTLTGAGISGTVPTGWTVEDLGTGAVAVCSIPTAASISASDPDLCPWLQVAVSNAGTAGVRISATDSSPGVRWGPQDGFTYHGIGQIQVDTGITGAFIQGILRIQNSGGAGLLKAYDMFMSNTPTWRGETAPVHRDWVFKSWDITVPALGAKMQVGVDLNAVGTLRLRRCVARRTRTGN